MSEVQSEGKGGYSPYYTIVACILIFEGAHPGPNDLLPHYGLVEMVAQPQIVPHYLRCSYII